MSARTMLAALAGLSLACATSSANGPGASAEAATQSPAPATVARAALEARSGSALTGEGVFTREGEEVVLTVAVTGVSPGTHAVHLHEKGDCSAPDASSAGGHWNPTSEAHGQWGHAPHHLGDVGNLEVGEDGSGRLVFRAGVWEVGTGGERDIVGHALVVHEKVDDFTTQPTGAAGGRIGCGVVVAPVASAQ